MNGQAMNGQALPTPVTAAITAAPSVSAIQPSSAWNIPSLHIYKQMFIKEDKKGCGFLTGFVGVTSRSLHNTLYRCVIVYRVISCVIT